MSKLNSDAMNVDRLVYMVDRMIPGTKTPSEHLPEFLQRDLRTNEDYINVDLVELAKENLKEEFGGTAL